MPAGHQAIQARIAGDAELVRRKLLQPECASFFTASTSQPARGIALLLHGFTAGPWQYRPLAKILAGAGLHAFAARLPGHGATTIEGLVDDSQLPSSRQAVLFATCARDAFADIKAVAQEEKLPIYVVGFSAGGALALDLMAQAPSDIARVLLLAPLLRPRDVSARWFFRAMRLVPFGGRINDRIRFAYPVAPARADGWRRPGHDRFHLGNVHALFGYASKVHRRLRFLRVPTQMIVTATDERVDVEACRKLVARSPGSHGLWCFDDSLRVPHAMLTPEENPEPTSRAQILDIAVSFLTTGKTQSNGPAVA